MNARVRVGAGAGSSAASSSSSVSIPANARRVVQDLKEIVKNSDDEIYAMLKECNMDPNETVQRLLNQDTFHEVKRKRDKRKENASKESAEARTRVLGIGSSMRGGRAWGRGYYGPRHNSEFSSGGRGQQLRDNGLQQNGRTSSMVTNQWVPTPSEPQPESKASSSMVSDATPGPTVVSNGSFQYSRVVQGTQNNWGPGQATMAGVLKAGNAMGPPKAATEEPLYPPDGGSSSVSDLVLPPYVDSHTSGSAGAKQNTGIFGFDRTTRDITSSFPVETSSPVVLSEHLTEACPTSAYSLDTFSSISDAKAVDTAIPSTSTGSSLQQDLMSPLEVSSEEQTAVSPIIASQFNGRVAYQGQPLFLDSEKGSVQWGPKSPVKGSVGFQLFNPVNEAATRSASSQDNVDLLVNSTAKLQKLNMHEDQPVIIPDHLLVPEADRTHLSFGSFGEFFDANSNFVDEEEEGDDDDDKKSSISEVNNLHEVHEEDAPAEQPTDSSVEKTAVSESYHQSSSSVEALVAPEDVKINFPASSISQVTQAEVPKAETLIQQTLQHPIMSAMHGCTGTANALPQIVGGQFNYETPEPQVQEVSRVPSFMSYSDPSLNTNYYTPVFRPSSDFDARYTQLVSAAASKYSAGIPVMTGQGLSSSQEDGSSITTSPAAGQASQTFGLAQGALTIPPQHIPVHAYPAQHAGVPLTPFGANVFGIHYVPPSYGYMHSPYQHSYAGSTGYSQASGSSYTPGNNFTPTAPVAGAGYTSTGAAAMKYALPQYKPGVGAANAPHAALAVGYGNFGTSPSGFTTMNPALTSAAASGSENISGPQFKDNNLYIPSQQPSEGSGVWVQHPLPSRDMVGMPSNSYYNLLNQGQHNSFARTQSMNAVPAAAYASLYHQSQSGSTPAVHQLLQQPQALGAIGGVGVQSGAYLQQQQRGQQLSWTPNY